MRRTIGYMMRFSMYISSKLGSEWWEIERDWNDIVDFNMKCVFEDAEEGLD